MRPNLISFYWNSRKGDIKSCEIPTVDREIFYVYPGYTIFNHHVHHLHIEISINDCMAWSTLQLFSSPGSVHFTAHLVAHPGQNDAGVRIPRRRRPLAGWQSFAAQGCHVSGEILIIHTSVFKSNCNHPPFYLCYGCLIHIINPYGWFMTLLYQHWVYMEVS